MDSNIAETMKNIMAKGNQTDVNSQFSGSGYITEKLYMLLQLYLQNKGWTPSLELLQCFSDLKESAMLPSATYLQMLASRVALDSQGRLILRENGKIILPFEHFANAVMLKHMNGPHGLHLSLDATVRAVLESYTIGREDFGMEKEFILEVVQSCPSPTCRFYKAQLDLSQSHSKPTYIPEVQPPVPSSSTSSLSISVVPSTVTSSSAPSPSAESTASSLQMRPTTPVRSPSRPPSVDLTAAFESVQNGRSRGCDSPAQPPSPKLSSTKPLTPRQQQQNKLADFLKQNMENIDSVGSAPKVLREWDNSNDGSEDVKRQDAGQEKIIRAFSEIMKNMSRMKSCVRPSMCKPYGKQSEALQKTVIDTIQLVQSLRSFLPPPHIAVSSWKSEDKHSRLDRKTNTPSVGVTTAGTSVTASSPTSTSVSSTNNGASSTCGNGVETAIDTTRCTQTPNLEMLGQTLLHDSWQLETVENGGSFRK